MLFRKMLVQDAKKTFSNVSADLLAIPGVEQDYLSVSFILFSLFLSRSLSFKAFSYSDLPELKTCSLEELQDNLSSAEFGRCFIIWGGWFEEV